MNDPRINLPDESDARPRDLVPAAQPVPATRDPYSSAVGRYGYGYGAETSPSVQIDLRQYLRILVKHRWMILSIVAAALVLGAVITLMKTPLYTSTVRLQIDRNAAKVVQGGDVTPEPEDDFMGTQYQLLKGMAMADRVASALKSRGGFHFLSAATVLDYSDS